jgi:hypothetical protein
VAPVNDPVTPEATGVGAGVGVDVVFVGVGVGVWLAGVCVTDVEVEGVEEVAFLVATAVAGDFVVLDFVALDFVARAFVGVGAEEVLCCVAALVGALETVVVVAGDETGVALEASV